MMNDGRWGVVWIVTDLVCGVCGGALWLRRSPYPLCLGCGAVVCEGCEAGHVCEGEPLYKEVGWHRLAWHKEARVRG